MKYLKRFEALEMGRPGVLYHGDGSDMPMKVGDIIYGERAKANRGGGGGMDFLIYGIIKEIHRNKYDHKKGLPGTYGFAGQQTHGYGYEADDEYWYEFDVEIAERNYYDARTGTSQLKKKTYRIVSYTDFVDPNDEAALIDFCSRHKDSIDDIIELLPEDKQKEMKHLTRSKDILWFSKNEAVDEKVLPKEGDKVRCIKSQLGFTKGEIYSISRVMGAQVKIYGASELYPKLPYFFRIDGGKIIDFFEYFDIPDWLNRSKDILWFKNESLKSDKKAEVLQKAYNRFMKLYTEHNMLQYADQFLLSSNIPKCIEDEMAQVFNFYVKYSMRKNKDLFYDAYGDLRTDDWNTEKDFVNAVLIFFLKELNNKIANKLNDAEVYAEVDNYIKTSKFFRVDWKDQKKMTMINNSGLNTIYKYSLMLLLNAYNNKKPDWARRGDDIGLINIEN